MSRKNLLICFDAFGTLFAPHRPVAQQYAEVATSLGLHGITEDAVQASFKKAFKDESKAHPNYGKASGMDAEGWWTQIIRNTISPLLQRDQQLPPKLVPTLLHRFWSKEGYMLLPDVPLVLRGVRNLQSLRYDRVVIGVITNSDDRVPDILTSLGLNISPLRYGGHRGEDPGNFDIDFSIMSYDVGHEKPDRRIFAAAEEMVEEANVNPGSWEKIYVGDEYAKDVVGATDAGWKAVLIGEDHPKDVESCHDAEPSTLEELFASSKAVGFRHFARFAEWLR